MNNKHDWDELVDRHFCGELNESDKERLAEMLDSDARLREDFVDQARWHTRFAELLREKRDEGVESLLKSGEQTTLKFVKVLLAVAAVVIIAFALTFTRQPSPTGTQIAKITGSSGSLLWTFDGGRVVRDLSVGTEVSGGTVEGVTPDSWVELEFNDRSTVTISGVSMLTFADNGQKQLHLKEGNFSGNINPQPAGKPMLVHTRTATFEVLGTKFNVDAGLFAATLSVSEGKVRVKRLSDGNTVTVPARHRVTAAADREMSLEQVPDSVHEWKSQLQRGPSYGHGKWLPKTGKEDARLVTVPYTTEQGKTIYTTSLGVLRGETPPVVLKANSRIRVSGRIRSANQVYFGITLRQANGDFAGRFQTIRPASEFQDGGEFEVVLHLRDFGLDPSLEHMKSKLPSEPFHLIVESVWCHTLNVQAGLEIMEVELMGPSP